MEEKTFEIRDTRIKEKFVLDDAYLNGYARKCGVYASAVYMSLCRHSDKEQECWPSLKKIADEHNISIKQAGRAIKILEDHRIIVKKRLGKKLNNRYYLLDKSEWTDSPISERTHSPIIEDSQSDHQGTDSPIHSKVTHLKVTHKEGGSAAIAAPTPKEEATLFFNQMNLLIAGNSADCAWGQEFLTKLTEKYGSKKDIIWIEIKKFVDYWTEKNGAGTKERWQTEKTFEVKKRVITWFSRVGMYQANRSKKTLIT